MISNKRGNPQREMGDFDSNETYIRQHYLCILRTSI